MAFAGEASSRQRNANRKAAETREENTSNAIGACDFGAFKCLGGFSADTARPVLKEVRPTWYRVPEK